jgi:8-oxo-dGTP pyrophosphatase MutT (NUDIX family)
MSIYNQIYKRPEFAGVLLYAKDINKFLLCKRSAYVHEPGTWANIGGRLEAEESFSEGAIREAEEEVGYRGGITLYESLLLRFLILFIKTF